MSDLQAARADIIDRIQKADVITVMSHYNPDADAYGSALGLANSLLAAGKKVIVVNETGILERYKIIPGLSQIKQNLPDKLPLLIACDCGSFQRVGDSLLPQAKRADFVINIDHHISNEKFGGINLVDIAASSTCEIVYDLLVAGNLPITKEVASCLYAGIMGDTGSFRYSCTTPKTFRVAADLVERGASPTDLYTNLYGSPPIGAVKLQAECMLAVELSFDGQFAETIITEDMVKRNGASFDDTDGMAERVRDIQGVKIAASLRQDGTIWRISLRSANPKYNVSDVAASFGGGGHVQAAAFRSSKPISITRENLRKKIEELLS